jgi:hypothetical protein
VRGKKKGKGKGPTKTKTLRFTVGLSQIPVSLSLCTSEFPFKNKFPWTSIPSMFLSIPGIQTITSDYTPKRGV